MNNKILIGSIIAICILVGVSFTSVVGYRSIASDVKASPLFNIRSSRAIDEKSIGLTSEYVGKGEEITIPLTKQDDIIVLIHEIIQSMSKLSDESQEKLITKFKNYQQNDERFNNNNVNEIRELLYLLADGDNSQPTGDNSDFTYTSLFCIIFMYLVTIYLLIDYVIDQIVWFIKMLIELPPGHILFYTVWRILCLISPKIPTFA